MPGSAGLKGTVCSRPECRALALAALRRQDSMKLPILMTASVSTRGMKGACFSPEERERMYIDTLCFYRDEILRKCKDRRIVFVENSGWDLTNIRACVEGFGDQVEFISLPPAGFDISRGKGYNEILMINATLKVSRFIKEAGAFLKVTGRYPVYNIGYFLEAAERHLGGGGVFYGDMKDHNIYDFLFPNNTAKWNGHAAYTVLFAATVDFYMSHLASTYEQCCDSCGDYIECVWHKSLIGFRGNRSSGVSLRFGREPICGGMQGSEAKTIVFSKRNDSLKSAVMRFIGNAVRTLSPWLWL